MNSNKMPARGALALAIAAALHGGAHAADGAATDRDSRDSDVFTLGQITVTASREDERPLATEVLDRDTLWDFSKDGVAEALNLIPGVATTAGAGNRNETLISIRGFNRWQVPLLMDGIRLYLPADNRIDFDRFLTPDLSEIQVSKGYVSVINGPDGMGGAINLVTRRPVKRFESEVRVSASIDNSGDYSGNTVYANVGSRQEAFYFQLSVEQRDSDHWRLSRDFTPTVAEDGGRRDHTSKKDERVNMKLGFTPNSTDEYSFNFMWQGGEKHGIGSVTGTSTISSWDWPKWDAWSLYWLSHTQLDSKTWLKTRAYYNKFENTLAAYTNPTLLVQNFTSYYDDNAKGGSVELGTDHLAQQTLKVAAHYRRDEHTEWQTTHATNFTEPEQTTVEDTFSLALEDTWHVTPRLDLVGGISRDWRKTRKVEEFSGGVLFEQPRADRNATNYQTAAIYRYSDTGKAHLSYSDRIRFPTMFERFSSRFGGAISNPWLEPERARNVEIGFSDVLRPGLRGEFTVFHSRVKDAIQSVPIVFNGTNQTQSQNVGEATFKGYEIALLAALGPRLDVGGNYSYTDTDIDNPNNPEDRLTTVPLHKALVYAKWQPTDALRVVPSIEYASDRWSTRAVGNGYVKTGKYALLGLKLEYRLTPEWDVSVTGRNLLDRNYAVVDGYPQEGRSFIVASRLRF